eukprot:TRINITY_DN558_c0_g1_i1.p1 TRINITY_DN558_c0_g1~~TRINITY_DN558_c0_g1_i1.p1  ORF type:complete len:388 (-),score=72.20 TRINITY_DN558_c0_g1_i1:80-1243(-)
MASSFSPSSSSSSSFPDAHRIANFGAGPAQIPTEVIQQAQRDLLNISYSGMSIMEVSHRGKVFEKILKEAEDDLRTILSIPPNYKIYFSQGGGTGQFAAVPLNLLGRHSSSSPPDYLVSGRWSQLAFEESKLYTNPNQASDVGKDGLINIPKKETWKLNPDASYLYYCDNETIHGCEYPEVPVAPPGVPLVADMSSNFLTRVVDVSKFGVIFAGAQKNSGTSGLTIVIIREDLLNLPKPHPVPTILNWKKNVDQNSCLNTPPTMSIYIAGLVFKWILKEGGLKEMEKRTQIKADLIYKEIDQSNGFYIPLVGKESRSRVNVVLKINPESLQDKFVKDAETKGLYGLAGHRSVGGIRISLYNAITIQQTEELVSFMNTFYVAHKDTKC